MSPIDPKVVEILQVVCRKADRACRDFFSDDSRVEDYLSALQEAKKLPEEIREPIASLLGAVGLVLQLEGIDPEKPPSEDA